MLTNKSRRASSRHAQSESPQTVLLIANSFSWAIGQIAEDLCRVNSGRFRFLFYSTEQLRRHPDASSELARLVRNADVVHVLDPYAYKYVESFPFNRPTLAPIYHVIDWSAEAPNTRGDVTFVISGEWVRQLTGLGVDPEQLALLTLGIDTSFWRPSGHFHSRDRVRTRMGLSADDFVIGFFANAGSNSGDRKGAGLLVEALARHIGSYGGTLGRICVVLTGFGWDDLVPLLSSTGVEVRYERFVSRRRLRSLYNALDTYVVASTVEGGPATLLESMACGVPPVSTPVGLAIEAIDDGVNGILIPKGNAKALADAFDRLRRPIERARLGEAARRTVTERFDAKVTFAGVGETYDRAVRRAIHRLGVPPGTSHQPVSERRATAQRASVVLEDRLQILLVREHPVEAIRDLGPPFGDLLRSGRVDRVIAGLYRLVKFEAVVRIPGLKTLARRRRR